MYNPSNIDSVPALILKRDKMKKFFIILLLLVTISLPIYYFKFYKPKQEASVINPSDIAEVVVGDIESVVTAQGTLEPKDSVDIGAQVSGQILHLYFEEGDAVKKGDLIAEIDPEIYEAQIKEDNAKLKASYAAKDEQQANLKLAKSKYDRNLKLKKDKAISVEVFEDSENAYLVAEANLKSIEAQIEQELSNLDADKTNLSYTKIYSPMDGTIISQSVTEGQTINANQTTPDVVTVANLDVMSVRAEVAEADISKLSENMSVYFTTLGSQGRKWYSTVKQILPSPTVENDVVLYNVLVDVDNKDNKLMDGMTTQMFFVLSHAEQVPIIPKSALVKKIPTDDISKGEKYIVKVLDKDGKTEEREILVNVSDRVNAGVAEGLSVGDKVLTGEAAKASSKDKMGMPPRMGRL